MDLKWNQIDEYIPSRTEQLLLEEYLMREGFSTPLAGESTVPLNSVLAFMELRSRGVPFAA